MVPVEQSMPVNPFSHLQTPCERHFPRPLQLLGHDPVKRNLLELDHKSKYQIKVSSNFLNLLNYFVSCTKTKSVKKDIGAHFYHNYDHETQESSDIFHPHNRH